MKVKITEEEKMILRLLDEDLKYIARDLDRNSLYLYGEEPKKLDTFYSGTDKFTEFRCFDNRFKSITFESGILEIEELIK